MFFKNEACLSKSVCRFEHPIPGFRCTATLGNDENEGLGKSPGKLLENAVESIRISVVEEIGCENVALSPERIGSELRAQGRAADPDGEQIPEAGRRCRFNGTRMDLR